MVDHSRLPGPYLGAWEWQRFAACRDLDDSLFFPPDGERGSARRSREAMAKYICMQCMVRADCAAHALTLGEPYGVWGGLNEEERAALMAKAPSSNTVKGKESKEKGENGET
ncbi:WhiB family transcriptional regulator [Streptomyces chryseus]